jgi:hypothetical protein
MKKTIDWFDLADDAFSIAQIQTDGVAELWLVDTRDKARQFFDTFGDSISLYLGGDPKSAAQQIVEQIKEDQKADKDNSNREAVLFVKKTSYCYYAAFLLGFSGNAYELAYAECGVRDSKESANFLNFCAEFIFDNQPKVQALVFLDRTGTQETAFKNSGFDRVGFIKCALAGGNANMAIYSITNPFHLAGEE